jgi:hypothetical protein
MTNKKLWKFLRKGMKSEHDNCTWKVGEWKHCDGIMETCENGFHASALIYDALQYVQGEILAEVEVMGDHADSDDKSAWSDMRVIRAWNVDKRSFFVPLAIFAAALSLANFEKTSDDKSPRLAIESAKTWVNSPTTKNAWSAAYSAESAESAERSAACSAEKTKIHNHAKKLLRAIKEQL